MCRRLVRRHWCQPADVVFASEACSESRTKLTCVDFTKPPVHRLGRDAAPPPFGGPAHRYSPRAAAKEGTRKVPLHIHAVQQRLRCTRANSPG